MLFCYKCGCELGGQDVCPNCGTSVATYKEILYTSNYLYNQGLEKAGVRDLSGAILCLKQSLWYNKDNLQARNLLGLIYYEIGETVAALCEWVISQNINNERLHQPDNLATYYLEEIQNNKQTMENIRASIERYNHALECCYSDNLDVAILQLKKVLGLNPHYLRARQLLSLLFIEKKDWKKAEKELHKCLRLDINNTTSLRYLKEVNEQLYPTVDGANGKNKGRKGNTKSALAAGSRAKKGRAEGGVIKYKTDNETIIQPVGAKVPGIDGFGVPQGLIAAVIGFILGAAIIAFMVMPQRVASVKSDAAEQVRAISEENNAKDATIADLQAQITTLTSDNETLTANATEQAIQSGQDRLDQLMNTAAAYIRSPEDTTEATTLFADIRPDTAKDGMNDAYSALFDAMYAQLRSPMLERYAWAGIGEYESESPDYATVIEDLEIANRYENTQTHSMTYVQRLYYLGDAYYQAYIAADENARQGMSDYLQRAQSYLQTVTQTYADSEYAERAGARLAEVQAAM